MLTFLFLSACVMETQHESFFEKKARFPLDILKYVVPLVVNALRNQATILYVSNSDITQNIAITSRLVLLHH